MEKEPLKRIDSPATGSAEADLSTLIDAIAALQTVDLQGLQRRLNLQSSAPHNMKNGQDASIRWTKKRDWETKYIDLKEKYDELDAAQSDLKGEINKQIEEKEKLNKELKNIRAELSMKDQASSEQNSEILRLKLHIESADKDINSLNQSLNEYKNKLELEEWSLQEQQKAMEKVNRAKNEALTRLSQQMRHQLSEGNPNITDLSNQNRPSKLGEIYSELYDNEWTNAFEVLTKTSHLDEKRAIELLLKILWESSKHASNVSQSNMKTIEKLLSGSSEGPSPECKRLLREAQKHVDIKKADGLLQELADGVMFKQMNSKCSKLLVAAIDVGAIDSGYAFLIRHEDLSKITVNSVWAGGNLMSLRCPTCVLFNEKKQFHSFGYEAEYKYSDLVLNNEHGKWYYFRRFKSILDNKQIQTDHCPLYPCSLPQDSRSNITLAKATEVVEGGNQDYELENTSLQYNYLRISYTDFVEKITRWDERIYLRNEHVEIYSKKCFQLCWLMSIQDPPVVLSKDPQRDAHFDTNMYKHYTNSGDNFDYVVWPALLLHKDGPLLTKGVAQPYPRPRAKSAPAVGRSARKDDKSFDGTSDDKLLESTSGSGRMDTTQYGYQTRNDATLFSKSGQNPMVTQTYSANGGKYRGYSPRSITPAYVQSITPAHLQVSELKQLYQPHIFQSKHDIERFQRFCQQVSIINEQDLRRMYGTYYDYYYTLYINQIFGDYRFT